VLFYLNTTELSAKQELQITLYGETFTCVLITVFIYNV